ncbi:MAG TPA: hypothetical protein DEP23_12535 [Ruminococcaceae bacterium]|nr:hypothetical protein [Oscillospiraceae bacterium]
MDNFEAIYKILKTLEAAMDIPDFDISQIDSDKLKISRYRWARYIEMMADVGYITGIRVYRDICGELQIENEDIRITLKGLEYLQENTFMQKLYRTAKGIKEVIPGI